MQDLCFGRTKQGEKAGSFFPPKGSGSPSASLYHPQAGSWTINDRTSSILKEAPVQISFLYSSVQFSRLVVSDSLRPHESQHARPPYPSQTQTHVHRVSDTIQPSHPLSSPFPPALNLSQHQGLSNESALHIRWPKYWSFSFSIIPSKEIPGLSSFRMDCLHLLAVQGTLKSLV